MFNHWDCQRVSSSVVLTRLYQFSSKLPWLLSLDVVEDFSMFTERQQTTLTLRRSRATILSSLFSPGQRRSFRPMSSMLDHESKLEPSSASYSIQSFTIQRASARSWLEAERLRENIGWVFQAENTCLVCSPLSSIVGLRRNGALLNLDHSTGGRAWEAGLPVGKTVEGPGWVHAHAGSEQPLDFRTWTHLFDRCLAWQLDVAAKVIVTAAIVRVKSTMQL